MARSERMEAERALAAAEEALKVFEESLVTEVPDSDMALEMEAVITTEKVDEHNRLSALRDAAIAHLNQVRGG